MGAVEGMAASGRTRGAPGRGPGALTKGASGDGSEGGARSLLTVIGSIALTVLVRTLGVGLLVAGLWAILTVLFEAVDLYRDPARVGPMVVAIERAAGLDGGASFQVGRTDGRGQAGGGAPASERAGLRPAYFFAWLVAIVLFLVIGKLADWLISRGLGLVSFGCRAGRGDPSTGAGAE